MKLFTLLLCAALYLGAVISGYGQFDENKKNLWNKGRAQLLDGRIVEGEISYNFILGSLSFRNNSSASHYYAKDLYWFELTHNGKIRRFYSLPYKAKKEDNPEPTFFEELYSGSRIALLSLQTAADSRGVPLVGLSLKGTPMGSTYDLKIERIDEKLYFADKRGNVLEYAGMQEISDLVLSQNRASHSNLALPESSLNHRHHPYKITEKDAIEDLTKTKYLKVKDYIKSQRLAMNTIDGMVMMIKYYESLF